MYRLVGSFISHHLFHFVKEVISDIYTIVIEAQLNTPNYYFYT